MFNSLSTKTSQFGSRPSRDRGRAEQIASLAHDAGENQRGVQERSEADTRQDGGQQGRLRRQDARIRTATRH